MEDLAAALIRFDNGASLMLEVNWALNFEEREKVLPRTVSGKKGGLSNVTFDYKDTTTCIFREENGAMVKTVPIKYPAANEHAQAHFIRCIREDLEPEAGASDGVEIMRMLDAIYASATRPARGRDEGHRLHPPARGRRAGGVGRVAGNFTRSLRSRG